MRLLFFIVLNLILGNVLAQNDHITISGSVDKKPNTLVELQVYEDFMSPVTRTVGFCETDDNKKFQIEFRANRINQYRLLIGNQTKILHLTPGFDYNITISNKIELIAIESKDSTNDILSTINNTVWDFRIKNKYKSIKNIKKLEKLLESYVLESNVSGYVKDYYKYKIGVVYSDYYIKALADTAGSKKLERELLFDSPVLFDNPKYFEFIEHHYFLNFLSFAYKYPDPNISDDPFQVYLNQLHSIKNDTVQQIAILSASSVAYTRNWGNQNRINQVVDSIKEASLHKSIESMAINLRNKYGHSWIGESVNDFTLYKSKDETVQLSKYFGKYLLLDFWFTGCSPCIEAMPLKKKLYDKYANKLEILSIDPVDKFERLQKWIDRNPKLEWSFLSAYQNRELINYFQINSYPRYFLIDPEGKVVYAPKEFEFKKIYEAIEEEIK